MITTDVVIVGAGPCGLFQVFELGLLGLKSELIDSIKQPGGQCTELYPDKPIYDIPAIPMCTGEELTENLLKQIEPFECGMHLGEEVTVLRRNDDDSFHVETAAGKQFHAKAVVIAGGVGSFQPRPIRLPGIDDYVGKRRKGEKELRQSAVLALGKLVRLGDEPIDVAVRERLLDVGPGEGAQVDDFDLMPSGQCGRSEGEHAVGHLEEVGVEVAEH